MQAKFHFYATLSFMPQRKEGMENSFTLLWDARIGNGPLLSLALSAAVAFDQQVFLINFAVNLFVLKTLRVKKGMKQKCASWVIFPKPT